MGSEPLSSRIAEKMTDYNYSVSCGTGSIWIGDDEFTKAGRKPEYQQSCRKRNGHRVWYGNRVNIAFGERRVKNMEPKKMISPKRKQSNVEAGGMRNILTWIRF